MSEHRSVFRSYLKALLPCLLFASLAPTPVHATRVRALNLEEMTQRAARILSGRCLEVRVETDPSLGHPVTLVTLEVGRVVKGPSGRTATIRLAGGIGPNGRPTVAGMPRFEPGEEVILFVYGESRSGLTSPVGLGQGKFQVREDSKGRRLAVNEGGNRTLLEGLSPRALEQLGGSAERWRRRGGIPSEGLLDMAESLTTGRRP